MKPSTLIELREEKRATQKVVYYDHCERLMRVALRYLGNLPDAEEVLQDAFVRIFEKISDYDAARGTFEAWSSRITINFALTLIRKRRQLEVYNEDLYGQHLGISNEAEKQLELDDVIAFIDDIEEKYAVVFKLKAMDGFSHKDIAEMLDISVEASRTLYSRARKKLEAMISRTHFPTLKKGAI